MYVVVRSGLQNVGDALGEVALVRRSASTTGPGVSHQLHEISQVRAKL